MTSPIRILCLGNELLADDAFGLVASEELRRRFPQTDVVFTTDAGLHLIDYLSDVKLLLVVDTIQTGNVSPGTLYLLRSSDIKSPSGPSPHYLGLFDTIRLAEKLLHNVPEEVIILAVEAADCLTLGGEMHPAVRLAVDRVAGLAGEITNAWQAARPDSGVCARPSFLRALDAVAARCGNEGFVLAR